MGLSDLVTQFLRPKSAAPPATKTSRAGPMIAWSNVGQPKWTPRRSANLAEEGFRKNVVAYRCVNQIATCSASVPWILYNQNGQELDTHPLLDLLAHPNPLQDGVSFMESVYANLQISGNAYIEAIRPNDNAPPVELYNLRPDRMHVIPGPQGLPQGYQYNVNGQVTNWAADPITGACDILHLKTFHPLDDWYGLAPMEAALLSIDQHNAAGAWNQALLNQGARPSGALVYSPKDGGPATLSDDQLQRLREEMGQLYQGDRNAGRPLILEGGLDWREMSLSPKDMDWLAGRNNAARDIALAFGVPSQLIGLPDAQTYANIEQARMAFYEETVLPLVTRVIAGVDHWLCPMYRDHVELDYDADSIGALNDKRQTQWAKLQNASFLTRNEQRAAAGYGPIPGGDDDEGGDNSDEEDGVKFNPNHDPTNGQFTSGSMGADIQSFIDDYVNPAVDALVGILPALGPYGDLVEAGAGALGEIGSAIGVVAGALEDGAGFLADDAGTLLGPIQENIADAADAAEQAAQRLVDTLNPADEAIGSEGGSPSVRELAGGSDAAQQMFTDLTPDGTLTTPASYAEGGAQYTLPDGSLIGYRPTSNSGPPTIDVNTDALKIRITKLKFIGE